MDAAMVGGKLTQVRDDQVTLNDGEVIYSYETDLPQFKDQKWVVRTLGQWIECKVVDGRIIEILA